MTAAKKIPPELWRRFEKARDEFEKASGAHRAALDRVTEAAKRQITEGTTYADQEMIAARKASRKTGDRLTAALEKERLAAHDFRAAHKNPRRGKKTDPARERANERLEKIRSRFPSALEGIAEFLAGNHAWIRSDARDDMIEYTLEHPDVIGRLKWGEVFELADYHARLRLPMANPSATEVERADRAAQAAFRRWSRSGKLKDPAFWRKAAKSPRLDAKGKRILREAARDVERKGSPRANPAIVPHAREHRDPLTPGTMPPRKLALLAELVELVVKSPNGSERTIRPKPNTAAMLTDSTGEVLWFVWPTRAKRVAMPTGARREKRIFETWSKHRASVALKLSTGEKFPHTPIGVVRVVRYRSDKWTGEPTLYEHEFTSPNVKAYADNARSPRLIFAGIPAHDPRQAEILVTSRGLVG